MRRVLCLLSCLLILPSFLFFSAAGTNEYAYPEPEILQIDLIMQPYRYLKMVHSEEKQKYDAVVCMNEGEPQKIGVQIRGDRSLKEGMESPAKRVPLELCFDYADPDGTFRGNPSLKLINCLTPARVLAQLVAMQAFAFLDIPTPNCTPAFIRINDTDFGVYLAIEDINESFAQKHFGGASLYRPIPSRVNSDDVETFPFGSTTMVTKVDNGSDTIDRYLETLGRGEDVESFFDVDEFLRFMACETFTLNVDGFIFNDRNFYLADDHGKLKLLPWDKDDVFSAFEDLWSWQEYERRCNTLFHQLTENEMYNAKYREYIRKLNDEFLDPDRFLPWLESCIRLLAPYFQRDNTILMRSGDVFADLTMGNNLFNTMTGNLLLTFKTYHDQADAILSGEAEAFSIPDGMALASYDFEYDKTYVKQNVSAPVRICAGYWRLRRQAFLQDDGKVTLALCVLFVLIFACTVLAIRRPLRRRQR